MTFREVPTIAGPGEKADDVSLALSNEANALQMAQARGTDKSTKPTDAAQPAQTGAPAEIDAGPLSGLLDPKGNLSPTRLFPDIMKADEKWMQPYNELTKIDGHALLKRHEGAMNKAGDTLYGMPQDQATVMRRFANQYLAGQATPDQEKALAENSDLMDSLKTLRETFGNPNLAKADELRQSVIENLGQSISLRTSKAQELAELPGRQVMRADGTSVKGNALGLIVETKELERYQRGGRM